MKNMNATLDQRLPRCRTEDPRAPKGKYLLCLWDCKRPGDGVSVVGQPYDYRSAAVNNAARLNKIGLKAPDIRPGELEYFVVDSRGSRVC